MIPLPIFCLMNIFMVKASTATLTLPPWDGVARGGSTGGSLLKLLYLFNLATPTLDKSFNVFNALKRGSHVMF